MWLLVGTIGFIFVVQFGPQSRGCRSRKAGPLYVAKVYNSIISEDAFRWAWIISRASSVSREQSKALRLKEAVLNGLIERELLAIAAEDLGIKVTEEEVDENILAGTIYYNASVHSPLQMPSGPIPIDFTKDDGSFDYDTFKMFVNGQFQMTLAGFKQQQVREILADKMRKIIENSVELFPDETRQQYDRTSNWIKVESATFDPAEYARHYEPQPWELGRWAQANKNRIETYYKDNEFRYSNVEKQVKIRNILIKVSPDAEEEEKEKKKELAESIAGRAFKGEDFATLARQSSEDKGTKALGGENPYSPRGTLEEKVEDAAFGMKPGEVKGPIETEEGYQIIKCEGFREGNVPLEEVRLEIARQIMTEEKSKADAKASAEKFLAMLKEGMDFDEAVKKIKAASPVEGDEAKGGKPQQPVRGGLPEGVPSVRTSGEISLGSTHIPGIGQSKELVEELLGMKGSPDFVQRVIELNDKFHVIRKKEHHEGSDAEFLRQKDTIERSLIGEKRIAMIEQWVDAQKGKAEKAGAIKIEKSYFKTPGERDESGAPLNPKDMGD
jgi:peptidyl-prolyl cis-trans isomerase D